MNKKIKKRIYLFSSLFLLVLLLLCEVLRTTFFTRFENSEAVYLTTSRLIGGLFALVLVLYFSFGNILKIKPSRLFASFLFTLPCWLIAINNFPFITFFSDKAYITAGAGAVAFYALECLCVGFFEEIVFRGCVLMMVMERRRATNLDMFVSILISSLIFGIFHLVNVFAGASIGAVLLQVGYSSLIGGMCAVVLMKTGCIWHCVAIHAVYNFCGGVVPNCGEGIIWDTPTIIWTAIVSVVVIVYMIFVFLRIKPCELNRLFSSGDPSDEVKCCADV